MTLSEEHKVLGDLLKIHFIENPGAAFGLTIQALLNPIIELSNETGKLILTLFSIVAVGVIFYYLYLVSQFTTKLPLFISFILGGAVGNIIDRVFYGVWFSHINDYQGGIFHGRVVDMFYVDIWHGMLPEWIPFFGGGYYAFWPIFNVADACISVGIVTLIIFQKRLFPKNEPVTQPIASENNDNPIPIPETAKPA